MKRLLVETAGWVPLPPAEARRRLVALVSGLYTESADDGNLVLQGGWWYRGEYEVEPDGEGTRVTHRVYNVAARGRWAVPLANRFFVGYADATRARFAELLKGIAGPQEPPGR
ncbi:hypothetical protein [Streptomyces hoynatensis]|uniref:hypothetical protein n=1 Tax=Streptomyces hoynatensis TaxID=1141874 RepID=UPI00188039FC|nr:hypothetical protein [Streptomyces hoynatensis]